MNAPRRIERDDPAGEALNVLVIGGDKLGLAVAECLTEGAQTVTFVSDAAPTDDDGDVAAIHREVGDVSDVRSLASDVTDVDLVVTLGSDSQALLSGYLARREFGPCAVVAGVDDPTTAPAFDDTGVDCISIPQLVADRIRDQYE